MYRSYAKDISQVIQIGHAGENKARCVVFDIAPYRTEFGEGTWSVVFSRDNIEEPYAVTDTYEFDNNAVWELTNVDTAKKGRGKVELRYIVNDVIVKTDLYTTELLPSLTAETVEPPTPSEDLLNKISEITANVKADAQEAATSAQNALDSATTATSAAEEATNSKESASSSAIAASDSAEVSKAKAQEAATSAQNALDLANDAKKYRDDASEIVTPDGLAGKVLQNTEDIADLSERVDERTLNILFGFPRTGKVYTVKIPKFAANPTTVCEKLDDNAALICKPSTDTVEGQDDYADIPLFKWFNCNYKRDENGHAYPTAIEGIDSNYKISGDVDVGVVQMAPYIKWDESNDGYILLSITDSPREGYTLWPTAKSNSKEYPYVIHSKYISGTVNGLLRSQPDLIPARSQSHNNMIINYAKKGTGYTGALDERNTWQIIFTLIKYATKSSQAVFAGCTGYDYSYSASIVRDTKETYFPLKNSQAKNIIIGSRVSVGYGSISNGTVGIDRGQSNVHKYADSAKVLKIEALDNDNSAVYLDIKDGFDTNPVAINENLNADITLTTMHWHSGATDDVIAHHDGSHGSNTSSNYPYRVQGLEYAVGGYVISSDVAMQNQSNFDKKVFCANGQPHTNSEATIVNTYKNVGTILGNNGTDYWIGDISIDVETGVSFATSVGASDSTGVGDRIYVGGTANSGMREALRGGGLGTRSHAGSSFVNCLNGLAAAGWFGLSAD